MACTNIKIGASILIVWVCLLCAPTVISGQEAYWDFSVRGGISPDWGDRNSFFYLGADGMLGGRGINSLGVIGSVDLEGARSPDNDQDGSLLIVGTDFTLSVMGSLYTEENNLAGMTLAFGPFVSIPHAHDDSFDDTVYGVRFMSRTFVWRPGGYVGHRLDIGFGGRNNFGVHFGIIPSAIIDGE